MATLLSVITWVISHVPMFHITQPLGINGLLDGYYKVMSFIFPKWDSYQPLYKHVKLWGTSIFSLWIADPDTQITTACFRSQPET